MSPGFSIPWQEFLMIFGGAASMTTGIFWGAYFLGKITSRIERLEDSVHQMAGTMTLLRTEFEDMRVRRVRHDD